jgi:putative tryptophan/tyrosine transport system substrate-binding protein
MIDRRRLLSAIGAALAPIAARAQATARVYRVGILRPSSMPLMPTDAQAVGIPSALAELGYVEGRNLIVEKRYANGDPARLLPLARELVQARVDVIVTVASTAVQAAKDATTATPIVMYGNFDPVALGLVASLARPGGNVTGVLIAPDGTLAGKRLELLKAAVPQNTRIAYLAPPDDLATRLQTSETRKAAEALGIDLVVVEARDADYGRAFAAITAQRSGALVVGASSLFVRDRREIIELAAKHRLPAIYEWPEQVHDGGLMAYGTSMREMYRRIAWNVDRILKGAKPADMPVERPTKFELVINLKTARALGLTIPQALLLRADEVIE